MIAEFHKTFDKQFSKLQLKQKQSVIKAVDKYLDNPSDPTLRSHSLTGEWSGYKSIRAGGDIRIHFEIIDEKVAFFVAVGTHSQLYK